MKAILAREFGGPDVLKLEDVPDPVAGAGQVRVRIHAVGVNPYDTYMRAGGYAIKPELPYIPGADAAGVIDQVGDGVASLTAGDRVYLSGTSIGKAHGAYAQLAVCDPSQVHHLPAAITFTQGAGLFVLCRNSSTAQARGINVNLVGRIANAADLNGNGIPEDDSGTDYATCTP